MEHKVIKIIGFLDKTEVCRYSTIQPSDYTRQELLNKVLTEKPYLKSENARVYIGGIPMSRYAMGQKIYGWEND